MPPGPLAGLPWSTDFLRRIHLPGADAEVGLAIGVRPGHPGEARLLSRLSLPLALSLAAVTGCADPMATEIKLVNVDPLEVEQAASWAHDTLPEAELRATRAIRGAHFDRAAVRMQQHHDGVRVFEGQLIAHVAPDGRVTTGTDALVHGLDLDTTPTLGEGDALAWAGVVIVVAIVAKFAGAYFGARLAGQSNRAAAALGAGLNARGALEIVIASVGLTLGVFSETAYTVIVLVPLVTSVFAAVSLRIESAASAISR